MHKLSFTLAVWLLATAAPLSAIVVCPTGEPKFVYNDVGNDGCFNPGVDTEIPATSYLGTYNAPVGTSIVVPKGVKVVGPSATNLQWHANHIFVRGKMTVVDAFLQLITAGRYEILGKLKGAGVSGDVVLGCDASCSAGAVIASKASLSATGIISASGGLDIEGGVKLGADESVALSALRSLGDKTSIVGTTGITLTMIAPAAVGAKVKMKTPANLSVTSNGDGLEVGDGASFDGNSINLGGSHEVALGVGVRMHCGNSSCAISSGMERIIGSGFKVVGGATVVITGSGGTTIAAGAQLTSTSGTVTIGQAGPLILGEGAKLTAELGLVQISGGSTADIGEGTKIAGQSVSIGALGVTVSTGAKLTATNTVSVGSSSTTHIEEGVQMTGSSVSVSSSSGTTIDPGIKLSASTSNLTVGTGGSLSIGEGSDLSGVGVTVSAVGSSSIADGVSIDATGANLSIGAGGAVTIGAGVKLVGNTAQVSGLLIDFGSGTKVTALDSAGIIAANSSQTLDVGAGAAFASAGGISLSSNGTRTLEDGVTLSAAGNVSLSSGAGSVFGNDVAILGSTLSLGGSGALTAGDGLTVETSPGSVSVAGSSFTAGDKLSLDSGSTINLSCSGAITIGDKGKVRAASGISTSTGSTLSLGAKGKWTGGVLNLSALQSASIGAGTKMSSGGNLEISSSLNNGALQFGEKVKLRSGTAEDPMALPSIIRLAAATLTAPKLSLTAADDDNTIMLVGRTSLSVTESKMGGKTITIGTNSTPAFTLFEFTYDKVKGTDEASTLTFQAAGATCDLTGSKFTNLTVDTTSCGTVVGP